MLKNAYLLAKIGADTVENKQHFAENLRKLRRTAVAEARVERRPRPARRRSRRFGRRVERRQGGAWGAKKDLTLS